jgi:hypothetical protein
MQLQEDRRNISGESDRQADKQTKKGGARQTARLTETVRGADSYFKTYREGDWQ